MIEKCDTIKKRLSEVTELLSQPEVLQDVKKSKELGKELKNLTPIVELYDEYLKVEQNALDATDLKNTETDPEMKSYFEQEIHEGNEKKEELEQK